MFIVYDKKRKPRNSKRSSGLLWGAGLTKNSALKNAKRWVGDYNKRYVTAKVKFESLSVARVLKADKDLFEALNQNGGLASFTVRKGRVVSVRLPKGY